MTYKEFRIRSDLSPARFRNDLGTGRMVEGAHKAKCERCRGILRKAAGDSSDLNRESATLFSMGYKMA